MTRLSAANCALLAVIVVSDSLSSMAFGAETNIASTGPIERGSHLQLAGESPEHNRGATRSPALTGLSGQPLALSIKAPDGNFNFVSISGVPEAVILSTGFRAKDKWLVAKGDLAKLHLVPSASFTGSFVLDAQFVIEGERSGRIMMIPIQITARAAASASNVPAPPAAPPVRPRPSAPRMSPEEETDTLAKADQFMQMGDVSKARLLYEDMAADGSAKGAYALAQTYDPNFLRTVFIKGALSPDVEKARLWYQKAMQLGSPEAGPQLSQLNGK